MASEAQEKVGFNWPPRRLSVMQRRVLVVTFETVQLERRALVERQFQLGGFLGAVFREVVGTKAIETTSVKHTAKQELAASSPTPNRVTEAFTATSNMPETSDIRINDTSGSNPLQRDSAKLLEALTDAVKEAIIASEQPLSTVPKHNQKGSLSDIIVGQSNSVPLSADSSFSAFLQTSGPTSMGNLPTPSVGLLGGFWGDSLTLRVHNVRAIAEDPLSDSSAHSASFLSDVSDIVAEISDIDPVAAAKLTDTVLDALHVDSSAIASAIPKVLNQASISAADLLPLVIPAVAKAMNQPLPQLPSVSSLDMVETLNKVLQQGTTVINDLSRAMEDITDPALLAVLNQLAMIVSAVANYLNKPLCAVEQVVDGTSFEEVIPCHSAETESLTSAGQLTTLATSILPGSPLRTSSSGGTTTLAPPNPYSSSEIHMSPPNPVPPSTSTAANPTKTSNSVLSNGKNGGQSMPNSNAETSSAHPSCPTCPSCDQCPQKICSVKGPESPSMHHPPDPSVGPCPGKGYKCNECLDGWFCPPQETPAQVVPCGVGWPCYHCSSGWFCAPKETPGPTPPPSSGIGSPITSEDAAPTKPPQHDDLPTEWSHLGCFQDAISRTLLGAKPVDYLQGDMSSKECVDHCISGGYKVAGTENGRECWCGTSIRDDAVRLPESQCGKPCQGQPTGTCGGSWAIDVFMCSEKAESPRGPPEKAAGGFMYRLLSNFRGNNGRTNNQLLHAVA
ncbi:wsc domain-containing [Trichoderma arundinaceum]|uniref:Wsc domain-containing n=1 Tax=Trichoderma arundinaceum TaxID=490622 RepID=A0A395NRK6_TRIAR|nr:wsc domain-containing [Trichoderma arundinaceum]